MSDFQPRTDEDRGLLYAADCIKLRRLDLGLTQQEAATRAGIGSTTWRLVENAKGNSFRAMTIRAMARALLWTPDSIDRLIAGEPPIPVSDELIEDHQDRDVFASHILPGDLTVEERAQVDAAIQQALDSIQYRREQRR